MAKFVIEGRLLIRCESYGCSELSVDGTSHEHTLASRVAKVFELEPPPPLDPDPWENVIRPAPCYGRVRITIEKIEEVDDAEGESDQPGRERRD